MMAVIDDLARLVDLELICEGADAWSETLIREGVERRLPTTTWLVAADGTDISGYAVYAVVDDVAELQRIGVDPAQRRRGIAVGLLKDVRLRARAAGATRLLIEVREDNDGALALYRGAGFVEIARRPKYYRDGSTAIVMEAAL
jgi:ribosomal-protein-alanine N-acetyltransferase